MRRRSSLSTTRVTQAPSSRRPSTLVVSGKVWSEQTQLLLQLTAWGQVRQDPPDRQFGPRCPSQLTRQ